MSKTKVLTEIALISALTTVVLILGGVFPSVALSLAALAGFFPAVLVQKHGFASAFTSYLIAGFLSLLLSPIRYAAALFILLFGFYQIIKQWLERKLYRILAYFCKFVYANCVFLVLFFCFTKLFFAVVPNLLNSFVLTWAIFLLAFFVYDFAGTEWLKIYNSRIRR